MFIPVVIWLIVDGAILTGLFASGMFIENPVSLLILLFFAVHLMPVWIWIGGIAKAKKKGREVFAVTDKKLYSLDGNKLAYMRLDEIERARAGKKNRVAVELSDGCIFILDGIAHTDEFALRLSEAATQSRA